MSVGSTAFARTSPVTLSVASPWDRLPVPSAGDVVGSTPVTPLALVEPVTGPVTPVAGNADEGGTLGDASPSLHAASSVHEATSAISVHRPLISVARTYHEAVLAPVAASIAGCSTASSPR